MRILAFIFFSGVSILVSVVTAQSHLRHKEMMPSLSAEMEDISDDDSLSYGGRRLAPPEKVEICQISPGNPEKFKTVPVLAKKVDDFLAKGALLGACSGLCEQLCDDGNGCTIDASAEYDCEVNGCPPLEDRAVNCVYSCGDNICDPMADPVCRPCQYDVNAYACPSPGLSCDSTTGCYHSEVCHNGDVPTGGKVCEPSHGGCVGPTSCTFTGYGGCNDGPNCATNVRSLAECEAAFYTVKERNPSEFYWFSGILFISYSGRHHDPNWDGVSEYNEDGACFVILTGVLPWDPDSCSSYLGDLFEPELNSGYIEDYDPVETVNCYDCT